MHQLLQRAIVVDHRKSPCDVDFVPTASPAHAVFVAYIRSSSPRDFGTWLQLAKCFKIWDIDSRGYHKSMWRLAMNGRQLLVVGVPQSPYS